ncbi:calcium-binding protein, partial [Vogesella sp. GCM10023246]
PDSVTVSSNGNDATLTFADGHTLRLSNQVATWQASDSANQYGVQEVHFADGTIWGRQTLREMAGYYIGTDAGGDTINTGGGTQYLYGYAGDDNLSAGDGNDTLYGGNGNDVINGESGNDTLTGDDGNDTLDGGSAQNTLYGGNGNDTLTLGSGATDYSYASGGSGNDVLVATGLATSSYGSVTLYGEDGSDTFRLDGSGNVNLYDYVNTTNASDSNIVELAAGITPDSVTVSSNGNDATLTFADGHTLRLSNQVATWQASDSANQYGIQEVHFADGTIWGRQTLREMAGYYIGTDAEGDTINTGGGTQYLYGYAGDDNLSAGAGNDQLDGGSGDDTLNGGQGSDTLIGGVGIDTFKWDLSDVGSVGATAFDTVQNFSTSDHDIIDLSDLLDGANNYNLFVSSGTNTTIHLTDVVGQEIQTIVLEGYGTSDTAATMLQNLLRANETFTG